MKAMRVLWYPGRGKESMPTSERMTAAECAKFSGVSTTQIYRVPQDPLAGAVM